MSCVSLCHLSDVCLATGRSVWLTSHASYCTGAPTKSLAMPSFVPRMCIVQAVSILSIVCTVRAEEDLETDNQLAMLQIKVERHHQPDVDDEKVHSWSVVYEFPLPEDLAQVPFWDPDFKALSESARKYALQQVPGKGGILDYQIVRSAKTQKFHRVWGGPAKKCGYWWTLSHPLAIAPSGNVTLSGFQEACGVCPEWNTAAVLETCYSKPGWAFVVGQGNSATCQNGETLFPPAALLQVNGDVCSNSLTCESCDLKHDFDKCVAQLEI